MRIRIRLIYLPGRPITLSSLAPKPMLLEALGRLHASGFHADLVDLGEISFLQETKGSRPLLRHSTRTPGMVGGEGSLSKTGLTRYSSKRGGFLGSEIFLARMAALPEADAHVYYAETGADYQCIRNASIQMRSKYPQAWQVLAGPHAVHFGECVLADHNGLDALCVNELSESLVQFAEELMGKQPVGSRSGLVSRNSSLKPSAVPDTARSEFACLPFDKTIQRTVRDNRFHLYPVSFSTTPEYFRCRENGQSRRSVKSVAGLFEEIRWLHDNHDASLFHLCIARVSMAQVEALARMILSRGLVVVYSLGDIVEPFGSDTAEILLASGCRSAGFQIPTGSQRLLEDYYGYDVSISAMRATLRHCRNAGLFTSVHLTVPCPMDDRHTLAETALFLEGSLPSAIRISVPEIVPDSLWYRRARQYGFSINHRRYQQYATGGETQIPYAMLHWNSRRISRAQAILQHFAANQGIIPDATEQEGLLLRLLANGSGDDEIMATLKKALANEDAYALSGMMQEVNRRATVMDAADLFSGGGIGRAVAFQ